MRRYLLLLLVMCSLSARSQALFEFDGDGMSRCRMEMNMRGTEITSLCIMRLTDDLLQGSVVNEFGIKAFDFQYRPSTGKTQLLGVMHSLNRRLFKRVIRKDLSCLFSATMPGHYGKRTIEKDEQGGVILRNNRVKLKYCFYKLDETAE